MEISTFEEISTFSIFSLKAVFIKSFPHSKSWLKLRKFPLFPLLKSQNFLKLVKDLFGCKVINTRVKSLNKFSIFTKWTFDKPPLGRRHPAPCIPYWSKSTMGGCHDPCTTTTRKQTYAVVRELIWLHILHYLRKAKGNNPQSAVVHTTCSSTCTYSTAYPQRSFQIFIYWKYHPQNLFRELSLNTNLSPTPFFWDHMGREFRSSTLHVRLRKRTVFLLCRENVTHCLSSRQHHLLTNLAKSGRTE